MNSHGQLGDPEVKVSELEETLDQTLIRLIKEILPDELIKSVSFDVKEATIDIIFPHPLFRSVFVSLCLQEGLSAGLGEPTFERILSFDKNLISEFIDLYKSIKQKKAHTMDYIKVNHFYMAENQAYLLLRAKPNEYEEFQNLLPVEFQKNDTKDTILKDMFMHCYEVQFSGQRNECSCCFFTRNWVMDNRLYGLKSSVAVDLIAKEAAKNPKSITNIAWQKTMLLKQKNPWGYLEEGLWTRLLKMQTSMTKIR